MKRARETDHDRGEFQAESRIPFADYAREWVERYHGTGRRGFREDTRADYRRDLERYVIPYIDGLGRSVSEVSPRDVANFVGWLCDSKAQGERLAAEKDTREAKPVELADATVRRILSPLRACLATAVRENIIRHNPTAGAALPIRDAQRVADEQEDVKALTREQLAAFLAIVKPRHRLLFRLLAATGLRISEASALRWRDVALDGSHPCLKIRRAWVRGSYGAPKSRYARRDIPLSHDLVLELRERHRETEWPGLDDLVFPSQAGTPLRMENIRRRVLAPAAEEAGVPWAGFHAFRHTCASLLFERGANAVQVQRWLGHHSAAFTLATYVHLLDERVGEPLNLADELAQGGNTVATHGRGPKLTTSDSPDGEPAGLRALSD